MGPFIRNIIWNSDTIPKFKKTVDSILGKHSDRGTEEQKDCSYFIGPFWLPIGVKLDGKLPATIDLEGFDSGQPTMGDSTVP